MDTICQQLREKKVLVSDGAWGTELVAKGLSAGECPELWNVERPDAVRDVARSYAEAGADIILTNTFGGNRFKLAHFGLEDRAAELNEAGARLSREAVDASVHVMGSMGATGKMVMMGDVTEDDLYDAFKAQAIAIERGGADSCTIETMSALDEICAGVRAAKENTQLEVACSMTFDTPAGGGWRSMMGVSPEEMAVAVLEAGADIIGANCSLGSDEMAAVVAALRAAAPDTPIIVHPNAGRPIQRDDGSIDYPETPEIMAGNVTALIEAGASIIGGCCGTGPEHIRAIRQAVDKALGR